MQGSGSRVLGFMTAASPTAINSYTGNPKPETLDQDNSQNSPQPLWPQRNPKAVIDWECDSEYNSIR